MSDILGTIEQITERGTWQTVLVRRQAADKYEREHPEKCLIPFDLPPFVAKNAAAGVLCVGNTVSLTYRLTGWEYNGKHYLSAAIESVESVSGAVVEPQPEISASTDQADEKMPF